MKLELERWNTPTTGNVMNVHAKRKLPRIVSALFAALPLLVVTAATAAAELPLELGPGAKALQDVPEIVFAVRGPGRDGHYYANFGHYDREPQRWCYGIGGGKLCRLDLRSGEVKVLLDDPRGGVRDPHLSYDARCILFSYRPGGYHHYHLYEVGVDGTGMRQLTDGEFDDFEPIYLPGGDIVFCSSRCNRFVACWYTPVAILYRCDADGGNVRMLSSNVVHDNTPWMMPDGRLLYTRWEYVDRSRVRYHHLWTVNSDGSRQMVFFGNQHGGDVYIDAKPIPGTRRIACIISPGHGRTEHTGRLVTIDPANGPDDKARITQLGSRGDYRDPYPLDPHRILMARGQEILLIDGHSREQLVCRLKGGNAPVMLHEPRPVRPRPGEPAMVPQWDPPADTAELILADVRHGRNMPGVKQGEVKKLLVLEQLPKPVNLNGTVNHSTSIDGTFTLKRILGTVPVEPDGSARFQVPALRSLFFVALDADDLAVKRMQSFVTLQPGEVTSCVGCHEPRTSTPRSISRAVLAAMERPPSKIEPISGVPDVIDFPRDVQPILDKHCTECHGGAKPDGGVDLTMRPSGRRIFPISYVTLLTTRGLVAHGHDADGNRPPRSIGSSASRLMKLVEPSHYDVTLNAAERRLVRLWIETGAAYPGTCAAMEVPDCRFDGPDFRPNEHYVREMKRYGLLPTDFDPASDPVDVFRLDRDYWRSLWYQPGQSKK